MRHLLLAICAALILAVPGANAQDEDDAEEQRRVRRLGDVIGSGGDEFSIGFEDLEIPQEPVEEIPEVSLPDPAQDARLQTLLRARAFVPDDPDTLAALGDLADELSGDISAMIDAGSLDEAQRLARVVAIIDDSRPVLAEVESAVSHRSAVAGALGAARAALDEGRLTGPEGDNAAELFARALELDPGNADAASGLEATHQAIIDRAVETAEALDFEQAEALLASAESVHEAPEAVDAALGQIREIRSGHVSDLDQEVLTGIDAENYDEAESVLNELIALGHDSSRIDYLQGALEDARLYGQFEPGQTFSDELSLSGDGPEMIVIPTGSFEMGSPDREKDRSSNEGPQHRVTFERGFALSVTEVSVGQFARFIQATGYRTDADISGGTQVYNLESGRMEERKGVNWRRDYIGEEATADLPVIHVSWRDAKAYAQWLSEETGRHYRLPSEAEFEYALRAGSTTMYWWGDKSPPENDTENITGDRDVSPSGARWNVAFRRYSDGHWGPAPVGSLKPNPFGLYDMGGNVMEWVEDCWHDSFVQAPTDGSAWVNPGCGRHVVRGASWSSTPAMSRSAFRISSNESNTDTRVGFRVARDL